jgi:hypothetical protein
MSGPGLIKPEVGSFYRETHPGPAPVHFQTTSIFLLAKRRVFADFTR